MYSMNFFILLLKTIFILSSNTATYILHAFVLFTCREHHQILRERAERELYENTRCIMGI